jgi:hypothetical protein
MDVKMCDGCKKILGDTRKVKVEGLYEHEEVIMDLCEKCRESFAKDLDTFR